ncbi:Translocation protein S66 [Thecaphora frezii]
MALSIFVPIGYIATLVVSMLVFSRIYRRRSALNLAKGYTPWFTEGNEARDIYQTLVAVDPPAPEEVLKAALLNRAMVDVRRIIRMRDDKQALGVLLQKGSIGDETMQRFALAEKELEAEILDVVSEANTFREGWGQIIFPTASEMVAHLKHKEMYYEIQKQRQDEVRKLEKAGKPVPQPTVELPPLITPPGTTIQVQAPVDDKSGDANDAAQLPPNLPPAQAAAIMQARAQLQAMQQQAMAAAAAAASSDEAKAENGPAPSQPATPSKAVTVEDADE